jgi:DNA ligase (NAD+)
VAAVLALSADELYALEGFQRKKAEKVYNSIQAGLKDVPLYKLQHASNLFKGLGSRKLQPLAKYDSVDRKPTFEEVVAIEGYSDITARAYLKAFEPFWQWLAAIPVTVAVYEAPKEGRFTGKTVVLTGFRSPEIEKALEAEGGKIGSSVSGKTYALVMKKKGSGSSKEKKALALGVEVYEQAEFEELLGL